MTNTMCNSKLIKKELIYVKSQYSDICQQINHVKQLISNIIIDKKDNDITCSLMNQKLNELRVQAKQYQHIITTNTNYLKEQQRLKIIIGDYIIDNKSHYHIIKYEENSNFYTCVDLENVGFIYRFRKSNVKKINDYIFSLRNICQLNDVENTEKKILIGNFIIDENNCYVIEGEDGDDYRALDLNSYLVFAVPKDNIINISDYYVKKK